jgi:starch-binding outer membrane protein, SusD/RagB family
MNKKIILYSILGLLSLSSLTSCQGLFNPDSTEVLFADENDLNSASDTVYSVVGIISKMQVVADRTVLLGELRGDLVSLTSSAGSDLLDIANFDVTSGNSYNDPSDYYAIINNCNYYIANVDTSLKKKNVSVFKKEYAAIKAFRAWTYFQLAQVYGTVPFVLDPVLRESDTKKNYPLKNIQQICEYFIDDLVPYINTEYPGYGDIGGLKSKNFYIPIRLLLGDLCLWAGRYTESATYYHDYLALNSGFVGSDYSYWSSSVVGFDGSPSLGYTSLSEISTETISYIPMQSNTIQGLVSYLKNVFNSTDDNLYYNRATYSPSLKSLSKSQENCKVYYNDLTQTRDTLYAPTTNEDNELYVGDLRLASYYKKVSVQPTSSLYSDMSVTNKKFGRHIWTYRKALVYLRYAEAMNRAGYPSAAFAVLKYGMTADNVSKYVDSTEVAALSGTTLLTWDRTIFTDDNTIGLHTKGSGNSPANSFFVIPSLASKADSILFVEDKICDEMALETAFEGYRMPDLMRIAMRRNSNAYLAKKVASRNGAEGTEGYNSSLYTKLLDAENWYLPLE